MIALGRQGYWRAGSREVVLLVGTEMFQRDAHAFSAIFLVICK